MEYPVWFLPWLEEAVRQLDEKNDRLMAEFGLEDRPASHYDIAAGTLTFSDGDIPQVVAEIQVIGTTSVKAGDWMWGWGNSTWPASSISDVKRVREFGEEHGIEELTHASLGSTEGLYSAEDLHAMAKDYTAIAVRVVDALGAFRLQRDDDEGGCYLFLKSVSWAPSAQRREAGWRQAVTGWMKRLKG